MALGVARPLLELVVAPSGSAIFSEDGQYRYQLTRRLSSGHGTIAFIMLNPSTADAETDDPTIRRCIGFARTWGYRDLEIVNLFALRATDPRELSKHADPVGPANEEVLWSMFSRVRVVVAAWGAHPMARERGWTLLSSWHVHCLGVTKDGSPRHPLYVSKDQPMVPYRGCS